MEFAATHSPAASSHRASLLAIASGIASITAQFASFWFISDVIRTIRPGQPAPPSLSFPRRWASPPFASPPSHWRR